MTGDPRPTVLGGIRPVVVGASLFADLLSEQGIDVVSVDWRPPPAGAAALERLARHPATIAEANALAVSRLEGAHPLVVGIATARDVVPGLGGGTFLHAGPPIDWADMSGPLRGAVIGGVLWEGLAGDPEAAATLAASGGVGFAPCHEHATVGPMAGVVTPSMPVWVVEDEATGRRSYSTLNEGLGKVLRYGAFDREVLDRLGWMRDVLAPVLQVALASLPTPLDLRTLFAQALQMGDEGHNRNRAATSLLLRELLSGLLESGLPAADVAAAARFVSANDHFTLNLSMAAAKLAADGARDVEASSVVVAMARNGTEFGVQISGTGGRWFTGPAGVVDGLYLPGFGPEDANPDIGDSTITETVGLGGFSMAAAPAIVGFVGGTTEDAITTTLRMYDITVSESRHFLIPALGFRGAPLGIDAREVVHTGTLPAVNTGIAHREPGIGQIGAGLVSPPMEPFVAAIEALADGLGGG